MAELLAVPLKKPSDVDIVKPLKNIIASSYSTADKPQDYSEEINELSKLRNNAVWRVFEKYESSLEVIYSYYDQLCALEGKIPAHEVQIPFKWKDAFDKGSLFGGRISLTVSSLAYEKVCVLFNIGALQSSVAASQSVESDEGLKLAAKLLQQASGIFNHLKGTVMLAIQQEPTPDLNPETLGALSQLMLAQAQEIFVLKSIHDRMKDPIVSKLCSQCEELYAEVLKVFQKEFLRPLWDKDWIPVVAGKQAGYRALSHYYQSLVCKADKSVGEEIARLEHAMELFKAAQQRSGRPTFFQEYANKAQRSLTEAKKDNDFIYHERIPDVKSLPPVPKAQLAKMLPVPDRLSQNFKDLFEELVPVVIHQALAAYDVRKNEIVNTEIMKLRESTQFLNSVLASLNLPAALEDTSGNSLPQSLIDKSEAMKSLGGLQQLERMLQDLPELLRRNTDILDEAERLLREEKESDDQLRAQFKERWTRTPSDKLTETFRVNATKYREIINNAMRADKVVRDKFETHRRGMELLSKSVEELQAAVPSAGPGGVNLNESSSVHELRRLMEEVETIKAERDAIECELKSATVDMQSTFLSALAQDGAINEQVLSVESLGRVFGPLQRQVKESIEKQEVLVGKIQTQNTEFCKEKSGAGAAARREEVLKELAAAHDAFIEIQNNLKEGSKFYNDLTQLLVTFQNKISDYCFARKTEKEELMKDLTQDLSRPQFGTTPSLPAHHTADGAKKEPPPRPPPPTTTPPSSVPTSSGTAPPPQGLPYPMYPSAMPVPYGASPAAPYPTYIPPPMPAGYNPYGGPGTTPYPQQGGYYPFPQAPWPAPGYPYPQQQQQPPQGRPW
ncbi:programmed cell death 6-interacting protein isoform X2 [Anabrus simplex]|uniref:programmed cell death 6-interacting protein isoform X2 n=1 Tax=Anabrus simplex TaxID=316456 RepID=UPI0034DDAC4D